MSANQSVSPLPAADACHAAQTISLDVDFETRWAAWVARGQTHEEIVRRKLGIFAGVVAIAGLILYAFVRSAA